VETRNELIGHGIYDPTSGTYLRSWRKLRASSLFVDSHRTASALSTTLAGGRSDAETAARWTSFVLMDVGSGMVGILDEVAPDDEPFVGTFVDHSPGVRERVADPLPASESILAARPHDDDPSYLIERTVEELRGEIQARHVDPRRWYDRIEEFLGEGTSGFHRR